jgi:hypothetical protein
MARVTPIAFRVPVLPGLARRSFNRELAGQTARAIAAYRRRELSQYIYDAYVKRSRPISLADEQRIMGDQEPGEVRLDWSTWYPADNPDDFFRAQARAE